MNIFRYAVYFMAFFIHIYFFGLFFLRFVLSFFGNHIGCRIINKFNLTYVTKTCQNMLVSSCLFLLSLAFHFFSLPFRYSFTFVLSLSLSFFSFSNHTHTPLPISLSLLHSIYYVRAKLLSHKSPEWCSFN